jgi:adenine-specific DNA-methyltransferase
MIYRVLTTNPAPRWDRRFLPDETADIMTDTAPNTAAITSPDMQEQRVQELKRLFPDLFDGEGKLDEAALRALMQTHGASGAERFRFEWAGKQESKRRAFTPSRATLVADKERSIDFDTTQNLIIEGDNLEVLKLLQTTYFEQVKCIYIDPPYNTGNDFIYPDNFAEGKKAYWQKNGTVKDGVKLQANSEAAGRRHSNWLNMMQSRLLIARQLLKEDGVIFVSIDDHEAHHLRKLCDEILGEESFIADINVVNNLKGRNDKKYIATAHERLLMYTKSDAFEEYGLDLPDGKIAEYKFEDEFGKYRLIELRKRGGADTRKERPNMFYPIYVDPETGDVSLQKDDVFCQEALPVKSNDIDGRWRWGLETTKGRLPLLKGQKVQGTDRYNIYEKNYLESDGEIKRLKPKSVLSGADYSTDGATKSYRALLPEADFDNPKPVPMIEDLITYAASPDSNSIMRPLHNSLYRF